MPILNINTKMKYFEKLGGAEAREMARVAAMIAKKRKKIKKVIDVPIKVIPENKAAPIIDKIQTDLTRSRGKLFRVYHKGTKIK